MTPIRRWVFRCRPCEFLSEVVDERVDAAKIADAHRQGLEHWLRFKDLEGVEPVILEEVKT